MQHRCGQQGGHGVVAQEGGAECRGRRQVRDGRRDLTRNSSLCQPTEEGSRKRRGQADDDNAKECAQAHQGRRILEGRAHTRGNPALICGHAVHNGGGVGRGEHALANAQYKEQDGKPEIVKVGRQECQNEESHGLDDHAQRREQTRTEAI